MKKTILLAFPLLLLLGCAATPEQKTASPRVEAQKLTPSPQVPQTPQAEPVREPGPAPQAGTLPQPPRRRHALPGEDTPRPPRPGTAIPGAEEKFVSLNFDNADIGVVIQTIAELIDLNYLVAPGVSGRVTIQSSAKIPVSSLFTVLEEILEVNSLSAVRAGDLYKIVPTNQARQKEIETVIEGSGEEPEGQEIVTKVVPLYYIRPSEVVKILNPLKSPAGLYLAHDPSKLLFITDSAKKIAEMMKIVAILDVDTFEQIQVELYPAKYIDVEQLAQDLTQIVTTVYASSGRAKSVFKLLPVTQINALLIISGEPNLARNIISWLGKMDQPAAGVNEQIFVYPLAHAKAEDMAAVITKVFSKEEVGQIRRTTGRTTGQAPQVQGSQRSPTGRVVQSSTTFARGTTAESPVSVVADQATNSLVILTSPWYYPVVEETIRKLDVMPKQVLIEVLIAELSHDDETRFGLQWVFRGQGQATVDGEQHNFSSQIQNVFSTGAERAVPTGFSWVLVEANRITAALNAYANEGRLNILSSPHVIATDNQEASINVGTEIPILTSQTTPVQPVTGTDGGTSTFVNTVTSDVEYRDTGVLLTVTPHINEGRFVTLDIRQEVSQAQQNELGGTTSPIIRKRTAETTMVVKDNQTLVIGGLMEEITDKSREGLPYLSRIPYLGPLFGKTVDQIRKTELVLLITPRVIANPEEGNQVSKMIRDRVLTLKEGIELFTDLPEEEEK